MSEAPNGYRPTLGEVSLAVVRQPAEHHHALFGLGPLVVGIVLFLLMVLLVPTVAPEKDVIVTEVVPVTTTLPSAGVGG